MKKLISYLFLASTLFINVAAGCSDKTEDPKPDEFQSMIGKWRFEHFAEYQKKADGSSKTSGWMTKDREIDIVWEFKSNGEFIVHQHNTQAPGTWKLNVLEHTGTVITKGTLTLSGKYATDAAKLLKIPAMVYDIASFTEFGKPGFFLTIDASKASPQGLETRFTYKYVQL